MKCASCGAQWVPPPNAKMKSDCCPFCGASLTAAPGAPADTMEEALRQLIRLLGPDILRSADALLSGFADLAPELKKERLLLQYLLHFNTHLKLLEAVGAAPARQRLIYNRAVHTLNQEQFIVREAAEQVCTGFLAAVDVTIPKEEAPAPNTPAAPNPTPPAQPPKQAANTPVSPAGGQPIQTYPDYRSALETLYRQNGGNPLTYSQVQSFVTANKLTTRLGITLADVEKDLPYLYRGGVLPSASRFAAAPESASAAKIPTAANVPYDPRDSIKSYEDYIKALTDLFVQSGRKPLNNAQILRFLWTHHLNERFGVTLEDVKKDLHTIAPSIC